MLWLSQNHNNHVTIHEHLKEKNLYDVQTCNPDVIIIKKWDAMALPKLLWELCVCNPDAIIIKKLGCCGSFKIIMIIVISLTFNNFIDAP
jgi:hypothetical protein